MILKAFKEKSNQKFLQRLLSSTNTAVSRKKIETLGIIIDSAEFSDAELLNGFFCDLGIELPKIKTVIFVQDENINERLWGNYFSKKDFGWGGSIKHAELQMFLNTEFDALVSLYKNDFIELKLATALSKANFKIGLSGVDDQLFDLILDLNVKDFDIFKTELKKYLTILNKI